MGRLFFFFLRTCMSLFYTHTQLMDCLLGNRIQAENHFHLRVLKSSPHCHLLTKAFEKSYDNPILDLCMTCFFSLNTSVIFSISVVLCNSLIISLNLCLFFNSKDLFPSVLGIKIEFPPMILILSVTSII